MWLTFYRNDGPRHQNIQGYYNNYSKEEKYMVMNPFKELPIQFNELTKYAVVLISLILLSTFFGCVSPYIFGELIDIIPDRNAEILLSVLIAYITVNMLLSGLIQIQNVIKNLLMVRMCNKVKAELFKRILYLTSESRDKYNTGELVNRIESDCNGIINFYVDIVTNSIIILFNVFFSITFLFSLSWINAIIVLINIIVVFIMNEFFKKKLKILKIQLNDLGDRYYSFEYDTISNSRHIKNFMRENIVILLIVK